MADLSDIKDYIQRHKTHLIIVSDAEPVVAKEKNGKLSTYIPAGGVAIALEPLARASSAMYIARGKTPEDKEGLDINNIIKITSDDSSFRLKRLFLSDAEIQGYYFGFANQTLWPLCHVAFHRPEFNDEWFTQYKRVNNKFAKEIQLELKKNSFVWINDYQLALTPSYLRLEKENVLGFFWHIPWPTWEVFRILPQKKEILESLLRCDYIAFHRGYQARNFIQTVERELEARIDQETNHVFYKNHVTTVQNLPMGIDADVVENLAKNQVNSSAAKSNMFMQFFKNLFKEQEPVLPLKEFPLSNLFNKYQVILGVDRLDYTKGIVSRLKALRKFFKDNPKYRGKVVYIGIIAPSREDIPDYKQYRADVYKLTKEINKEYGNPIWKPIYLVSTVLSRATLLNIYKKADLCLVTPLDDGMNLVSKEFVLSASESNNPGMLILSQFAGSAIDLTESIIVNPYNISELAKAIQAGLEMKESEKKQRIMRMAQVLEERNVYAWALAFLRNATDAAREKK